MNILTVSNLYPRPDQPTRGMFNAQLFRCMAEALRETTDHRPPTTDCKEEKCDDAHHAPDVTSSTPRIPYSASRIPHHAVGVTSLTSHNSLTNLVLVPEWRPWFWPGISGWEELGDGGETTDDRRPTTDYRGETTEDGRRTADGRISPPGRGQGWVPSMPDVMQRQSLLTHYLPAAYVPLIGRDRSWRTYEWSLRAAVHLFDEADVVYASWLYPDGVAAVNFAASRGKPAWLMVLGSDTFHLDYPHRKKAILDACEKAQGVVCVCNLLKERLVAAGVAAEKVHVVSNGVDTGKFYYRPQEEARAALIERDASLVDVFSGDRKVTLFVGNLVPVKGPDVFLKALARMGEGSVEPLIDTNRHELESAASGDGCVNGRAMLASAISATASLNGEENGGVNGYSLTVDGGGQTGEGDETIDLSSRMHDHRPSTTDLTVETRADLHPVSRISNLGSRFTNNDSQLTPSEGLRSPVSSLQSSLVVHSHNLAAWQYAALACIGTGARHVHTEHGTNPHSGGFVNRWRTRWLVKRTDQLIAVSDNTASALVEEHGIPRSAIQVIRNGVRVKDAGSDAENVEPRPESSPGCKQMDTPPAPDEGGLAGNGHKFGIPAGRAGMGA